MSYESYGASNNESTTTKYLRDLFFNTNLELDMDMREWQKLVMTSRYISNKIISSWNVLWGATHKTRIYLDCR